MKLIDYGSSKWETDKCVWVVLGGEIAGRDIFATELHKISRSGFSLVAQVGGDCLTGFYFHVGKFSGGFTIWGI